MKLDKIIEPPIKEDLELRKELHEEISKFELWQVTEFFTPNINAWKTAFYSFIKDSENKFSIKRKDFFTYKIQRIR